jgi:hypothetical protein
MKSITSACSMLLSKRLALMVWVTSLILLEMVKPMKEEIALTGATSRELDLE